MSKTTTRIAHADKDSITIRGFDLATDLIGERDFTEVLYLLIKGSLPEKKHKSILDACLVTLMEHSWTPSSLIARLMIDSVPDEMQVGMSAGLLSLGSIFAGTSEACARLLVAGEASDEKPEAYCEALVAEYRRERKPVPGFGHPLHKPIDPRTVKLLSLADALGISGRYVELLRKLSEAMDEAAGKPITLNATGAIAALLLEIGLPADVMRGLAVVSRSGGLIAHIQEERETHLARELWSYVENNVRYEQ
jgi:citrate synthase